MKRESRIALRTKVALAIGVGFLPAASVFFAGVALGGDALRSAGLPTVAMLAGAGSLLLFCAILDVTVPGSKCSIIRRQTPRRLVNEHHPIRGGFFWGLDTGSVISTYRASAASWAAVIMVVAGWAPIWGGLVYAAGFCVPMLIAVTLYSPPRAGVRFIGRSLSADAVSATMRIAHTLPALRTTSATIAALAALTALTELVQ